MKKFYVAHAEAIAMGMFAPDVALNMYGPFNTKDEAEKEVKDLQQRTREGIETARLNGKQVGRITCFAC